MSDVASQAVDAIEKLREAVDTLIIIPNDKLLDGEKGMAVAGMQCSVCQRAQHSNGVRLLACVRAHGIGRLHSNC